MTEQPRAINAGYRDHDGLANWQECDCCGFRCGADMTTPLDKAYGEQDDASVCPRCPDGYMVLPESYFEQKSLRGI